MRSCFIYLLFYFVDLHYLVVVLLFIYLFLSVFMEVRGTCIEIRVLPLDILVSRDSGYREVNLLTQESNLTGTYNYLYVH